MALRYIAEKNKSELTTAREVCDRFNTPFDTTSKVLQTMNQKGILVSVKGLHGGYTIAKPLSEISFKDFIQLIDGKSHESFCEGAKGFCELHNVCNIKSPLEIVNEKISNYLKTITLQDLLSDKVTNFTEAQWTKA